MPEATASQSAIHPRILIFTISSRGDPVLAPVVELGGAGGGMRRHLARLFQRAPILELGRDARAAEGVVADCGGDAGRLGATAHPSRRRYSARADDVIEKHRICCVA